METDRISELLISTIKDQPGHCQSYYCRAINGKEERYCYNKNCYANSWKRKRGICIQAECHFKKATVWRRIKKLAKDGVISITREKVKDRWMSRGWDWMKVCRPFSP